jgi:hypothetical protein
LIIARNWSRYEHVKRLIARKTGGEAKTVTNFLDSQAYLQKGDWRHAEQSLNRAHLPVDRTLEIEIGILKRKADDQSVLLSDRKAAEEQAQRLTESLDDQPAKSVEDLIARD